MLTQNKRIAVFIDTYDEYCQNHILDGLYRAGIDNGYTIVTFPMVSLKTSEDLDTHYDFVNHIVSNKTFDGIIFFAGALTEHTDEEFLQNFVARIKLPSVSVAGSGGNCAAITINNKSGISNVVEHLIEKHSAERIAFINGPLTNSEAHERFEAYKEIMQKYHKPIDDLLIYEGDFSEHSGMKGIRKLIENGFDFDAVVCADDITAIGALKELKNQEIFVPDYVTVTGFDDIDEASMYSPSLTTVRQPFAELGARSIEALKHYFDSHHTLGDIALPTEAVIRESCGCIPEEIRLLRESSEIENLPKRKWLTPNATEFLNRIAPTIALEYKKYCRLYGETSSYQSFLESSCSVLWNYFYESTLDKDNCDYFIHSFSSILSQHSSYSKSFEFWEKILSELNGITSKLSLNTRKLTPVNKMLQEARILYVNQSSKILRLHDLQLQEKTLLLHEGCEHILNSTGRPQLISTVSEEFLELDIVDAAMVLFPSPLSRKKGDKIPKEVTLDLLISGGKERQISTSNNRFSCEEIIPEEIRALFQADNYIFQPLYFKDYYFGYILLSIDKRNPRSLYEELRFHISANLYQEM